MQKKWRASKRCGPNCKGKKLMTDFQEQADAVGMEQNPRPRRRKLPARDRGQSGTDDRLPPHSEEDERGVLGCVLAAPDQVLPILAERRVQEGWFYDLRHRTIFAALMRLQSARTEQPVEFLSLCRTLKEMEMLEQVGGVEYLGTIQDSVPSAAQLPVYLEVVRNRFRTRNLIAWATSLVGTLYETHDNLDQVTGRIETELEALTAPDVTRTERHIKDVIMNSVLPLIERHYSRGKTQLDGLPTGENWYLDKVLLGLAPSDYVILAGRPGEGKTSLALNVVNHLARDYVHWSAITEAEAAALPEGERAFDEEKKVWSRRQQGIPIGIFTLEMTEDSLGFRLVFGRAKVSSGSFRQGFASEDMWTKVHKSVEELCKTNIYLDGEPDQNIDMIAAKARRWAKQYGIKLFVLDYLQLLDGDDGDTDRVRALRKISKKIVSLKKRLGIPWLVLAQMNRNIETAERARRPVMSDLKESGSLEQDADKIIILYHPLKTEGIEEDEEKIDLVMQREGITAQQDFPRRINALVVKNRNGPTGVASLLFQNNQCLFQDWRRWCVEHNVVELAKGEARKPKIDDDIPR
jgi:replicative DNA helicase